MIYYEKTVLIWEKTVSTKNKYSWGEGVGKDKLGISSMIPLYKNTKVVKYQGNSKPQIELLPRKLTWQWSIAIFNRRYISR